MFFEQYPALDAMLLSYPGAVRDYQPVWGWDRYLVAGKMYAGLLFIAQHKDPRYANHPFLSIKIDPKGSSTEPSIRPMCCPATIPISAPGSASGLTAVCRKPNWPACAAAAMIWLWPSCPNPGARK